MGNVSLLTISIQLPSGNHDKVVSPAKNYSVPDNRRTTGETKVTTEEVSKLPTEEYESSVYEDNSSCNSERRSYEDTKSVLIGEENKEIREEERKGSGLAQSKAEQPTVEEIDKFRTMSLYCCHLHPTIQYQLFEDSKTMVCSLCKEERCRDCFTERHDHGLSCDKKIRLENIQRQWKLVFERLELTGTAEDHLIACDNCKLYVFKHSDQKKIPCFFCSEELKNFD